MEWATGETPPVLSDEALVAALRDDPPRGLALLYDRYGRMVFGVALRIVGEHGAAEEITQDVFLSCWQHLDRYETRRGSLATWLFSIAHHRAIDELRSRRGSETRRSAPFDDLQLAVPHEPFDEALLRGEIRRALAELPPAQREVIELIYWNGLTRREVSAHLELPLGTVHTRIRLGMDKLRALLARILGDE
ncbi:MAG TPA: sigma-70 family RNA polymerase sigma factor [Roseiflexaceae bacterium]|nr:sigma-70 family RNA polymerase sigma factor [Roseiflexaceae bacterium]